MSRRALAEILAEQAEAHRRAPADAFGQPVLTDSLQPDAPVFDASGILASLASEASSFDHGRQGYFAHLPLAHSYEQTPATTDQGVKSEKEGSDSTERPTSLSSEIDNLARASIFACIEHSSKKHGSDVRKWPASARAFLAPTETLILRIHSQIGHHRHNIEVPKFPFIAASPRYRGPLARAPEQGQLTLISPNGNLKTWAVRRIAGWLKSIFTLTKNDEVLDIRIPDISKSWTKTLELRMTAIELGLGEYIAHIEAAYLSNSITKQQILEDGPLVFQSARKESVSGLVTGVVYDKNDPLLIALANRIKEGILYGDFTLEDSARRLEIFSSEERKAICEVGRTEWQHPCAQDKLDGEVAAENE